MPAVTGPARADSARHVVQFYGSDDELVDHVGEYLAAALQAGETAVIVATAAHRRAVEDWLTAAGAAAPAGERYIVLDAASTMDVILTSSRPDPRALERIFGGLIEEALTVSPAVSVYGEMSALLWEARHPGVAVEMEALWDGLGRNLPLRTLCGYPAQLAAENAGALRGICALHTAVAGIPPPA
jgi:MEDS: MEthanogen/methylotroph, DcmR Sensory domain